MIATTVPISLSDVITEIPELSLPCDLIEAFTATELGWFNSTYEGSKTDLQNFRGYEHFKLMIKWEDIL